MALTKRAKTWLIILSIPIVLLVGAVITVKLYFNNERLKSLLIPQLESATGRTVTVDDLSLSLFPSIGLDIRGMTIASKPGFSDTPVLSLERMLIDVKLRPLFSKRIEISSLLLEKPRIFLETKEDGSTNYSNKQPPGAQPEHTDTGASGIKAVLFSDLRIINGYIEMIDRRDNSKQVFNGFHEIASLDYDASTRTANIQSKTAIDNYSYGTIATPLISDWRINVEAPLLYNSESSVATITKGKAFVNAIPLDFKGTIDTKGKPDMDISINAVDVNVAHLLNLTPKAYVEKIKGVQGNGNVQLKIFVKGIYDGDAQQLPDISGALDAANTSIQYPDIAKPISNITLAADFFRGKTKKEFHLRKFSANLGQNPISVTADVINFDDPVVSAKINLAMNLAEVREYYPLEAGTNLSGSLKAAVNIDGNVSNPDAMKASGSMEFQRATFATAGKKNPVKDLNGSITFNNQNLDSKKLTMTIGKSDLSLAFTLRNYLSLVVGKKGAPKATATIALASTHLYTSDVMGDDKTGSPKQSGTAQKKNSGAAAMALPDAEMLVNASIGTLTMEKFEMKNVKGSIRIVNGIVSMPNLTMSMFDGSVASKGSVNLQNPDRPKFDLVLSLKKLQANNALSQFTSFGQRLFGDLNMDISIDGALDDTLGLIPSSLNASGKMEVDNGKLEGVKVNQQIANLVSLPDLSAINFKNWVSAFSIKNGRVVIPDLKITALGADYAINGSQGLDGSLDMKLALLLSEATSAKAQVPGFAGDVVKALKEPDGRLKLDFLVGGTMDNPKVQLDTQGLKDRAANFVKQRLTDEAKKKTDELKNKGEDLLKDFFKRKK